MLVADNCTPSVEGSNPFINTGKGVSIFSKGLEKSVVNLGCICSPVREELDDYALLDFRLHPMINAFSRSSGGNALL
jgi:hypothetical protein